MNPRLTMRPFTDSTHLIPHGPALAERMRRDGYLFLRGLMPTEPIRALQRQIGVLARDADAVKRARAQALLDFLEIGNTEHDNR